MSEFLEDKDKVRKVFQEIADIKVQMKELDDQLKTKQAIAFAFMDHEKMDKVETSFGNFTRVFMPIYSFSKVVEEKEVELKELKNKEKEDGIATIKSNRVQLRYSQGKE